MSLKKIDEQIIFSAVSVLQAAFTTDFATNNLLTSNAHGLNVGDLLRFTTSGTLPAGLSLLTDYYVISTTTNTFAVSATKGGSSVTLTDDGSGTHTFHLKGKVVMADGYQNIKITIVSANSANFTLKVQASNSFTQPDFNSAVSTTNQWFYKQIKDESDGSSVAGSTGIQASGSDITKEYEININAARYVSLEVSSWSAGTVEARCSLFNIV